MALINVGTSGGAAAAGLAEEVLDLVPTADLTYTYGADGSDRVLVGAGALAGVIVWNEAVLTLEESVTNGYWEATLDMTGVADTKWGSNGSCPAIAPALLWEAFGDGTVELDAEIITSASPDGNFAAIFAAVDAVTPNNSPVIASVFGAWAPKRPWAMARWQNTAAAAPAGIGSSPAGSPSRRVVKAARNAGDAECANSVSWESGWLKKDTTTSGSDTFNGDVVPAACHAGVGLGGNTNENGIVFRIYRVRVTRYPWPEA